MTTLPPAPPSLRAPATLPRAQFLSYITNTSSPTRIRKMSARALHVIGAAHGLTAACAFAVIFWNLRHNFVVMLRMLSAVAFSHVVAYCRYSLSTQSLWLVIFLYAATFGAVMFACAKPVGRGKSLACRCALLAVVPLIPMLFFATLFLACEALLHGLGIRPLKPDPVFLFLLVPAAASIVLLLLVKDIAGFLTWIAANPLIDMPPVPFLPGASDGRLP